MAEFSCDDCGREGHFCPLCGSSDVVFALAIDDLPDDLLDALVSIAAAHGGQEGD
jgi:hypothetical protein